MNMFRQIKEMRRLSREIHSRKSSGKDREGNYVINIGVSDGDTFLSPYSIDGEPLISAETAAFMEHSVKHLRPDAPLHFVIRGKTIDETEKPKYDRAIRDYYRSEFIENARDIRKNTVQSIIMTLTAAFIFATAVVLDRHGTNAVILNMIDVVAWVFMWEAADIYFFQRSLLKLHRRRALSMIEAVITFTAS